MRDLNIWHVVSRSAAVQIIVSGLSGLLGIFTSRLIISHYGVAAYGQYGLLTSLPTLMPFADLGIAVVIVNSIAGSSDPQSDPVVRRTITSAFRVLLISALTIVTMSLVIQWAGWWPLILGAGLLPGGDMVAMACLMIFGLGLPLGIGARILVGLGRNPLQAAVQGLNAPIIFFCVLGLTASSAPGGNLVATASFLASAACSALGLVIASRLIHPQIGEALKDVVRLRAVPNVKVLDTAWPMVVQMISLPIAMQTGRLLLSHMGTSADLAQYNLASQLFGIALQSIATAGVAFWPYFAKARSERTTKSPMRPTAIFAVGGLVIGLAVCAILPFIVQLVAQGQIELSWTLVLAFLVFTVVQAAKYPAGMYMTDARGLRFQIIPILLMIPLNLTLIWWFIPIVGAAGPVVATSISVVVCQVLPNLWWVRRDLRRRADDVSDSPDPQQPDGEVS